MNVILVIVLLTGIGFLILTALAVCSSWKDSMTGLGYSEKELGDWNSPVDC